MPYAISLTCPSRIVTRRSMRAARSRLCVATSAASPLALTSAASVPNTWSAVFGSRLPVGSSASSTRGPLATARAMATRCCSPPDNSAGRWLSRCGETEIAEELARAGCGLGARQARDHLRQDEVLERRELRQQMMELVDEADLRAPQRRPLVVAHGRGRGAADPHFAGVRPLQAGPPDAEASIFRRRTARSAPPTGPARARAIGAAQDLDRRVAPPIAALHAVERSAATRG